MSGYYSSISFPRGFWTPNVCFQLISSSGADNADLLLTGKETNATIHEFIYIENNVQSLGTNNVNNGSL